MKKSNNKYNSKTSTTKKTTTRKIPKESDNKYNSKTSATKKTKTTTRKSPKESATKFPVNTVKIGLDGKKWIIAEASNGVKRWIPHKVVDLLKKFSVKEIVPKLKLGKIKKIGKLDVTTNSIGIGELLYQEYNAPKGIYYIYHYAGSLIAVHEKQKLNDQVFEFTRGKVLCDIGMFSFNDCGYIKKYVKKREYLFFPDFETDIFIDKKDKKILNHSYVYDADLDINIDNNNADSRNPIAIFADNKYGDGTFSVYRGQNAFWIMSYLVGINLLNLTN